jgi:hypothetical protein
MELAAAEADVRDLLYLLVEVEVFADMLAWALERAATGQWRVPSRNFANGVSTRDVALRVLALEVNRGYTRALEEQRHNADAPCCWEEGQLPTGHAQETEAACDDLVYDFCKSPLAP